MEPGGATTKQTQTEPSFPNTVSPVRLNNLTSAPRFGTVTPNCIFVGGIDFKTKENDLRKFFAQYGSVKEVKIVNDRAGVSKRYGFITFETVEDAQKILQEAKKLDYKDMKLNIGPAIRKEQIRSPCSAVIPEAGTMYLTTSSGCPYIYHNGVAYFSTPEVASVPQPWPLRSVSSSPMVVAQPVYQSPVYHYQAPTQCLPSQWQWSVPQLPFFWLCVNICMMVESLHMRNKGSSMEGIAGGENLLLTAADDKGITMSHSGLIRETPKKLQDSFKNVFSLGCDKSLFSLSTPPQKSSCHYCGLSASLRCSQCKQIYYCSADCQKEDWPAHSVVCEPIKQNVSNNNGGKLAAKTEKGIYFKGNSTSVISHKTEEHIKKIMLSDLQAPGIKKAMEVQGTVTEFKSPSEFYIQMSSPEVSDQISKLSVKLQDCYAHTVTQEEYIAVKGEVCIARCSLDQTWNRALIKDVDILQKKAQVFYIDYGNEENIPLSWIKALHKDIELLFPPCVIKCSFAKYDPKEKGWNEGITSFSSQLMGKHCSVTIVDILHEEMMLNFAVDIVVPNLEDCLRKVPVERRTDLTPGSNAKRADSPRVSKNCSKGSKGKIPADEEFRNYANSVTECVSVCIGAAFSGVVSHVQNPENFFCQHIHSARQLAELQASLNEHCDKFPSSPAFRPAVGDVCCAQFTEDDLWYRAAVLAYASEDTVFVVYIDYGNSEVLPLTRLRPVIPRLVDLPAQAIKCTLAGVKPPRGAWTSKAVSVMKQLVNNKVFAVKVVDKDSYSSVVELVDASVTPGISVSRCLVEKGCAAEESRMASPAARRSDVKQSDETSLGHWKPIELAIGETLSVCVTEVDSPDLFYVIPLQIKDKEKLRRQVIELEDYCKSCKNQPFTPKLGEACCARFSGDGCWYRAFVLKAAQSAVRVLYADYGNTETLPLSKVLPIPDSYLNLPFQTIMCSLADIEKAEWSPLLLDKLKEMILNKHIRITVKGINGNVHLVMVEKLSGSSCLNVADQLVMEGFVKLHTKELHTEHQGCGVETKCCCAELKMQLKKHERILLFLLDKCGFPEIKNLLDH